MGLCTRYSYLKMTAKPVAASAAAAAAIDDEAAQPLKGGDKNTDLSSAGGALPAKQLPTAASLSGNGHAQLSARSHSLGAKP